MQNFITYRYLAFTFVLATCHSITVKAADVDVYFITGQSNAANFAQRAGSGTTDVGYNLEFSRTRTIFDDPSYSDQSFSSNNLDTSQAVTLLSQSLFEGNDQAIYGFARNGTTISDLEAPNWYPGTNPSAGQVNDSSLYGDFVDWADARLQEITNAGNTPIVKGLFWFQGERDAVLGSGAVNAYESNFENLVYRFRDDFGANLPIVATDIREGVSTNAGLRDDVNQAIANVAANDSLLGVVSAADLSWVSANDVHLNNAGYIDLVPRWASKMQELQDMSNPPLNPSQTILVYDSDSADPNFGGLSLISSETDAAYVFTADASTSLGGNVNAAGPHPSQSQTVSFGNANDRMFQFGEDLEVLSGTLEEAALDDGEWIGATFTAGQDFTLDKLDFDLFVNSANTSNWSARDAGLFLRSGDSGPFTQFGEIYDSNSTGDQGTVTFEDEFSVADGESIEWRLAFTDRTNVSANLVLTRATRIGSIKIGASVDYEADFDGDGDVDIADLDDPVLGWKARYANDLAGVDFLTWQRQYGAGIDSLEAVSAVPEPKSIVLLGFLVMTAATTHKRLTHQFA